MQTLRRLQFSGCILKFPHFRLRWRMNARCGKFAFPIYWEWIKSGKFFDLSLDNVAFQLQHEKFLNLFSLFRLETKKIIKLTLEDLRPRWEIFEVQKLIRELLSDFLKWKVISSFS